MTLSCPTPTPPRPRRRRRELIGALRESDGAADAAFLVSLTSRTTVRRAMEVGAITRLGPGVYGLAELALTPEPVGVRSRSWARWQDGPDAGEVVRLRQERAWARAHGCNLSHRSAAKQHDWPMLVLPETPEVVLPRHRRASASLLATGVLRRRLTDLRVEDELAATDALQTALLCAADLPVAEALAIADSALRSGAVGADSLRNAADTYRGRGLAQARYVAAVANAGAANPFESALRALALQVVGLAVQTQVEIGGDGFFARVDLADRALGLVIEADSYEFHGDPVRFAADCVRYDELTARGWSVLRFTFAQVRNRPEWVVAMMRGAVEAARRTPAPDGAGHRYRNSPVGRPPFRQTVP